MSYAAWVFTVRDTAQADWVRSFSHRINGEVLTVVDPGGLGNLGGTLLAWAQTRDRLRPHLLAGTPVAIVHDAGSASRTQPLSTAAGSRGAIVIPGMAAPLTPLSQLEAVARFVAPAAVDAGPVVDVHWGSQLIDLAGVGCLPDDLDIAKFARPWRPGRHSLDLGVLVHDGRRLGDFSLAGSLASDDDVARLADRASVAQDIGSFRVRPALLDQLPASRCDLDPGLIKPALRGESAKLSATGVGVLLVAPEATWVRLRRPSEHLLLGLDLIDRPNLRERLGLLHPVTHSLLGDTWIEGPEISWDDVREGIVVGGVRLDHSWVLGSTVAADSHLAHAGMAWSDARVTLESAVISQVQAPVVSASGSLLSQVRSADALHCRQAVLGGAPEGVWQGAIHVDARANPAGLSLAGGKPAPPRVHPASTVAELTADIEARVADRDASALVPWLTHPSPTVARLATRAWLAPVMARCDTLDPDDRAEVVADLCELWAALSGRTGITAVDALPSGARLLREANRLRRGPPALPDDVRQIAVLSRVTLGADLTLTLPVIDQLLARWPAATVTVFGPAKALDLLCERERVRGFRLSFRRGGALLDRLATWASVHEVLADYAPDLVVSPDTRIDQLGTLPLGDHPVWFLDTTRSSTGSLGFAAAAEVARVLGTRPLPPRLHITPAGAALSKAVAIKLGVGGDERKCGSLAFERAWLRGWIARGWRVVLDLGIGDERHRAEAVTEGLTTAPIGEESDTADVWTVDGTVLQWAAQVARCRRAQGYDSLQGHLAAALGLPTDVVFKGHPSPRFLAAWTPWGEAEVRGIDGQANDDAVLAQLFAAEAC